MKSPKDYVEEYQIDDALFDRHERPIYLQGFIAEIQKDAYNQAIQDAINAEWREHNGNEFTDEEMRDKLKIK